MRTGVISTDQIMDLTPSGAWPGHVGVHCVAWHPSLRRAPLLASGTASGLARVDWVEGESEGQRDEKRFARAAKEDTEEEEAQEEEEEEA
jgi:transcription factor C subunit 6